MVFVFRRDKLEAREGKPGTGMHVTTLLLIVAQREFELNYDHLDQRHGTPAMGA